jgi:hypothetical protein
MHCQPASAATRQCEYCADPFTPRRSWARYCSTACRNEAAAKKLQTGMRGIVSSVRCLRRGGVSVTLRFTAIERERVLRLSPGDQFVGDKST